MYFIKYHPLKEQLRDRCLTDREAFPYYFLFCAFSILSAVVPQKDISMFNKWDAVFGCIMFIVNLGGLLYCYSCNGGKTGYDFIQKSIVLGWVVVIRCFLVFILITIVFHIIRRLAGLPSFFGSGTTSPLGVAILNASVIVFYERLGRHLKDTNNKSANQASEAIAPQGGAQPQR